VPRNRYVRLRFLDRFRDGARRRRAREAALAFEDPALRAAAERVYFVIERVSGVAPAKVNLDAPMGPLIAGGATDSFWDRLEVLIGRGEIRRIHAIENMRIGSVRHLIQHLCLCKVCGPDPTYEVEEWRNSRGRPTLG
jgi:hypothetical protein